MRFVAQKIKAKPLDCMKYNKRKSKKEIIDYSKGVGNNFLHLAKVIHSKKTTHKKHVLDIKVLLFSRIYNIKTNKFIRLNESQTCCSSNK